MKKTDKRIKGKEGLQWLMCPGIASLKREHLPRVLQNEKKPAL